MPQAAIPMDPQACERAARPQKISARKDVFASGRRAVPPSDDTVAAGFQDSSHRLQEKVVCAPLHASPLASGCMQACSPLPHGAPGVAAAHSPKLYAKQNFLEPVPLEDTLHMPMSLAGILVVPRLASPSLLLPLRPL